MSQFFHIHPDNPQKRLIAQAVEILRRGGVIAYPTDSGYALGCGLAEKRAVETIKRIRRLDQHHNFTLMCADLSQLGLYAKVDNARFRLLKAHTPGPYTFILPATSEVPRLLLHPKRRSIGLRVPENQIARDLIAELGAPIMSVTLILPEDALPQTEAEDIRERIGHELDLIIDGGACSLETTTVVDLRDLPAQILRVGRGDPSPFADQ